MKYFFSDQVSLNYGIRVVLFHYIIIGSEPLNANNFFCSPWTQWTPWNLTFIAQAFRTHVLGYLNNQEFHNFRWWVLMGGVFETLANQATLPGPASPAIANECNNFPKSEQAGFSCALWMCLDLFSNKGTSAFNTHSEEQNTLYVLPRKRAVWRISSFPLPKQTFLA